MTKEYPLVVSIYINTFLHKFMKNQSYSWISTLRNARYIFWWWQKETNIEENIFDTNLEDDLNFLNEEAVLYLSEEEDEETTFSECRRLARLISEKSRNEIIANFKNHKISKWDLNTILFSCGVAWCLAALESKSLPSVQINFLIKNSYNFLLTNNFALQYYFFLKKNNIFSLNDKLSNKFILISTLQDSKLLMNISIPQFLENLILIWDLLEYPENEYLQFQSKITKPGDLSIITNILYNSNY